MTFESQLINNLRKNNEFIGDDCAIFDNYVITTDALVEDIHFSRKYSSDYQIGFKTAAVSLSDIASMGATPVYFLLSLSLPKKQFDFVENFLKGFSKCLEKYNVKLIGGDTTGSKNKIYLNGTAIGKINKKPILRKSAKENDYIYVTKIPGTSALGLYLLENNKSSLNSNAVNSHLCPNPEVEKAIIIANNNLANSMQDVSDGISKDLGTICSESNCGAILDFNKFPKLKCEGINDNQLMEFSLHGGEDYSLLFTSEKKHDYLKKFFLDDIYCIGRITKGKSIKVLINNEKKELSDLTYNHF